MAEFKSETGNQIADKNDNGTAGVVELTNEKLESVSGAGLFRFLWSVSQGRFGF